MITVEEIMTAQVFTLGPQSSVYEARCLMRDKDIRHLPVVNDANQLVGLVTQRDLLSASESTLHVTSNEERQMLEKQHTIDQIMVKNVKTIDERESLRAAATHLRKFKHGCLPVVTEGELRGIITDTDFVAVALHLMEQVESAIPAEEF